MTLKEDIADLLDKFEKLEKAQKALEAENKTLREKVDKLEKAANRQSDIAKRAEIEKTKTSVIIKGVPVHKDVRPGEAENRKQTGEVISNLLKSLDIGNDLGHHEAIRFKPSEKSKGKGPEFVKLTVSTVKHKATLYEALAKAKDKKKKIPKVSVTDEVPNFLREKHAQLDEAAYNLRQKVKGIKTRIFFKGCTIVLKAKKAGEDSFSEVDENGEPPAKKESPTPPAPKSGGAPGKIKKSS